MVTRMPSSTSNSELEAQRATGRRFTLTALLWGAFFVACYALWFGWAKPEVNTFQNHSARNMSRAEVFLHGEERSAVLVGSSLSQLIPPESLGAEVYNMGFSRESSLTGLGIVVQAPETPQFVIIEANYILREANEAFIEERLNPLTFGVKDTFSVMQVAAQPMNLILSALRGGYGRSKAQKMADKVDDDALKTMLTTRLLDFADPPKPEALKAAISNLKSKVDTLIKRGSTPILLLMPVEPELEQSPYARTIRQALYEAFPKEDIAWVAHERQEVCRTTDSEHLLYADAWYIGERIAMRVAQLSKNTPATTEE